MRFADRGRPGLGAFALLAIGVVLLARGGCGDEPAPGIGDRSDGGGARAVAGAPLRARVLRVIDGDTIRVSVRGREEDVRYIGVDTPETVKPGTPVQCYGRRAGAANHRLVEGRTVRLAFDRERRDAYDRLLAYVHAGSRFVNAALVRAGFARTLTIPPNTRYAGTFRRLAADAGQAGRGLWGAC